MERPTIICLTPVRNEAWILNTFLQCTSLWADYIIIADQHSTDGSREIALRFPKVRLIENNSESYNEQERQALLISEARKISGKRLLITLDADELFTADFKQTNDWQTMMTAPPGSVFGFNWINLMPGYNKYWISEGCFPWAYMDDGASHTGDELHNPRVPLKNWDSIIPLKQIRVLHYQYVNWKRMQKKQQYYQCLERIKYPHKSAVDIFRIYHHMYTVSDKQLKSSTDSWFALYEEKNIQVRSFYSEERSWFENEIIKLVKKHGAATFQKEYIWKDELKWQDPRNSWDRLIHAWLNISKTKAAARLVRATDKCLKRIY